MLTPLLSDRMRHLGVGCLVVAALMFVAAAVIFAAGFEPAFLAMLLALGLFTFGVGAVTVGRR
ncbi:hypothetical protein [Cryobacterium arcticum]|uniref:Uncharacterized protein n=1 Tax=Cryobacterium arcticum TaxID=670052 RepID=A0A1B1BGJ9_9MICO|nr:hypothetical protein [Cryobacterium arcticum]ANP71745.1 hypothetical protein PA27867_0778 [Cryobacterium arcticum]